MPDQDAVLVCLRQLEAMSLQDCARPVKRAPGRNGVGDLALRQQLERLAGVVGNCRLPVEQRSIEVENYEFNCKQALWGKVIMTMGENKLA